MLPKGACLVLGNLYRKPYQSIVDLMERAKMNLDLYLTLVMLAFLVVGIAAGYAHGFKQGKEEGYALGRSVARHTFWSE